MQHVGADGIGARGEIVELRVNVWRDVTGGVTRDAAPLNDGRDIARVVDRGRGEQIEGECGGGKLDARFGGRAIGEDGGDGVGHVIFGRHGEGGRIGVVERAAIGEEGKRRRPDYIGFEVARRAEFGGDDLRIVDQDGRVIVEEQLFGGERGAVGGGVGINLPDDDVARGEAGAQGAQRRGGLERARTARAGEHEHDGLGGGLIVKLARDAAMIGQAKIGNYTAGGGAARRVGGGGEAAQVRRQRGVRHRGQSGGEQGEGDKRSQEKHGRESYLFRALCQTQNRAKEACPGGRAVYAD